MPGKESQKQPWTMLQLSTGVSKHTVGLLLRFNEISKQSKNVWLRKLKITLLEQIQNVLAVKSIYLDNYKDNDNE